MSITVRIVSENISEVVAAFKHSRGGIMDFHCDFSNSRCIYVSHLYEFFKYELAFSINCTKRNCKMDIFFRNMDDFTINQ